MSKKFIIAFLFTFSLFIFFSLPFFHDGFFQTMDDVQVVRIAEMTKELRSGQFPVRYIDSFANGGGYMLFNYYSPLAYYVGSIFVMMGISLVKATKLVFLTSILIGASGFFFLLKKYTNLFTATLSVGFLLVSAYLGYDIYHRGALAEVWGFMFFPWILWSLLKVKDKPTLINCIITGIFYALAILSHIAIVFVFSLFLFFIIFIPPYNKKSIIYLGIAIILGLIFSAFFWLPLLLEEQYIIYSCSEYATIEYLHEFVPFLRLLGIGIRPMMIPPTTLGLGLSVFTFISSIFLLIKKKNSHKPLAVYFIGVFIVSMLLTLFVTKPLWENISYLRYLQSPWRFLTISTTSAIFICGLALSFIKKKWVQYLLISLFVVYTLIFQKQYLRPHTYTSISEYKAEGKCPTTTWKNEYLPKWVTKCLPKPKNDKYSPIFANKGSEISNFSINKNGRDIFFQTKGAGYITIAKYYFPGWELLIDGKEIPISPSIPHGLIGFNVPEGKHKIQITFHSTPIQKLGNILSLGGLLIIISIIFVNGSKINKNS